MTRPCSTRSHRLPSAPPRISASPHINRRWPPRRSIHTMNTLADDGDAGEEPALPARRAREEAERGAGVVREHEAEEARDRHLLAFAEHARRPTPWSRGRARSRPRRARASATSCGDARMRAHASSLSLRHSCAARRRRTGSPRSARTASDAPRSAPTSARQCQQRSHFGLRARRDRHLRAPSPRDTVAADVIITKRRSSPSDASAS